MDKNINLKKILREHKLWLESAGRKGCKADLSGADLSGADLRWADLSEANLSGADLYKAYLSGADLYKADLSGADLSGADLRLADLSGADLSGADLYKAYLSGAYLYKAYLSGANLRWAYLRWAYLSEANLSEANLSEANLSEANLSEANLSGADLSGVKNMYHPMACPEKGSFTAFKKANGYIVELFIPKSAKRSSSTSRKCRCDKAKVVSITKLDGTASNAISILSNHDPKFVYTIGEYVSVDDFDNNRWNECAPGIHFFITREEAVRY